MRLHLRYRYLLFLCLVALATGCTQLKYLFIDPIPPRLQVSKVTIAAANLNAIKLKVQVKITNDNEFSVAASETKYQVWYKDTQLAQGEHQANIEVPARGSLTLELPIKIAISSALDALSRYMSGRELAIKLTGRTTFHSDFGSFDLDFNKTHKLKSSS